MSDTPFYSLYYERTFSEPELRNALRLYLSWNMRRGFQPELVSTSYEEWREVGSDELWSTVLYHAEIEQWHLGADKGKVDYCTDVVCIPGKGTV